MEQEGNMKWGGIKKEDTCFVGDSNNMIVVDLVFLI